LKDVTIPVPEQIGPYRVVRPLAQGGMAAVFEAEDPQSGELVAVKLLTLRGLATTRFSREYRALTRLDHPNIVRVYRYGVHNGSPFLCMELLDGVPIQAFAKAQGRPGNEARTQAVIRVAADIADALQYLHERKVVHRDLKSANILVLGDGQAKLLDFGTAHIAEHEETITRHGEFVGTFAYASPEQITGGKVTPASDLYSLGVLLYRLCTGRRPFKATSSHELARLHVERKPVPPRRLVPELPVDIDALILRLLEKDPADRPESATVVAQYLRGVLKQLEGDMPQEPLALGPARIVGRDAELRSLRAMLERARPGRMVLVVGPNGAGRSRFLGASLATARQLGWRSFEGAFDGKPGLGALLAVAEAIQATFRPEERPALPVGLDQVASLGDGAIEPDEAFDAVARVLLRRADLDPKPVVIGLTELDRASPQALECLAHARASVRSAGVPMLFAATCLDEADAPGTALRARLADAWRLELAPLDSDRVGELMHAILGGCPPGRDLARQVHAVTGGLPGYVGEVVRALVQGGLLVAEETPAGLRWQDETGGQITIPGDARAVLSLRLDHLAADATRVLEALGVAGGEASLAVLAHAVDRPEDQTAVVLQELTSQRMVKETGGDQDVRWAFRLGLTQELVGERLRDGRRGVFRRRLAEAVVGAPPDAAKIRLLVGAGRADEAIQDGVAWATPMVEWVRVREVRPVLEAVIGCVSQARETDHETLARLFLLWGRTLGTASPGDPRARAALVRAGALAPTEWLRGEVDLYDSRLKVAVGELDEGRKILERARERLRDHPDAIVKARVARDMGAASWYRGHFVEAERWFDEALTEARQAGHPRQIARSLVGTAVVRIARGALREAEAQLREATVHYETAGDRDGLWHVHGNLCDVLRQQGCFTEATELLQGELRAVREAGTQERLALMLLNLAEIEVELMRLGRARQRLEALEGELASVSHLHIQAGLALVRAKIALASSEPEPAVRVLEPMVEACSEAGMSVISESMRALLGEARYRAGDREGGAEDLAEAISQLQGERHLPALGEACAARARALGDHEDPDLSFGPVLEWMRLEPVRLLRMEYLVASARYALSYGQRGRAHRFWRSAEDLLQELGEGLSRQDREAMAVHPWVLQVRRGLHD